MMFGIFKLIIVGSVALVSLYNHQQEILNLAALDARANPSFVDRENAGRIELEGPVVEQGVELHRCAFGLGSGLAKAQLAQQ